MVTSLALITGGECVDLVTGKLMTSVFFRLTVSPKWATVVQNWSKSCWASCRVWARSVQSSAYRRSRTRAGMVFLHTWSRRRLNTLPSARDWIGIPRLQFLEAASSIMAKKAEKQRCQYTALLCLIGCANRSDNTPDSISSCKLYLCNKLNSCIFCKIRYGGMS